MEPTFIRLSERERLCISGPAGAIQLIVDFPNREPKGVALIGHSHPLLGGTSEDKVTHTLASALSERGYVALRPSFRGTGGTEGTHDKGKGECDDMLAVHEYASQCYRGLPVLLAGFSFGAYVQSKVAKRLGDAGKTPQRMILVSTALGNVRNVRFYDTEAVPEGSVLIHGTRDDRVPFDTLLAWAEKQNLPVVTVPGADHFFNGRLHLLRKAVEMSV